MTPTELREAMAVLRWSWRDLGEQLGRDHSVVQRWRAVPPDVAGWLTRLVRAHRANPPPIGRDEAA